MDDESSQSSFSHDNDQENSQIRGSNNHSDEETSIKNVERSSNDSKKGRPVSKICFCKKGNIGFMVCCDECDRWYHGRCVKITKSYANKLQKYFCTFCREENPELELEFKVSDKSNKRLEPEEEEGDGEDETYTSYEKKNQSKIMKSSQMLDEDDDNDSYSPNEFDDDYEDEEFIVARSNRNEPKRKSSNKGRPKKTNDKGKSKGGQKGRNKKQSSKPKGRGSKGRRKNDEKKSHDHHRRGRHKALSDDSGDESKSNMKQCYGPKCTKAAQKGSKYCSDECGLSLSKKRLIKILPHTIAEWQKVPSAADKLSMKELSEICREQQHAADIIAEIGRNKNELKELIERGKSVQPYNEEEMETIDNESECDYVITCVTCGQEVPLKSALKHMGRCYNKTENRTSFYSTIKFENQDVVCDYYFKQQRSYCKRLRILCPEHYKETRMNENEVCGCPLRNDDDPFIDDKNQFCRSLRKNCNRHYGWEKSRQAFLDAQILQQWLKLDELKEREQKVHLRMRNRHGVIPLLLHRTYDSTTPALDEIDDSD